MEWSTLRRSPALSVPDRLSLDIERAILEGELKPGDRLPNEQALAEQLGVSRVSIRQALHELEQRGLLDRKPGRGTTVRAASLQSGTAAHSLAAVLTAMTGRGTELTQIMELRALIEPPIAALAAARVTPRDIEQLRTFISDMENETDLARYSELDRAFHQAISQYTHNPLMAQLTDLIATQIAPSRRSTLQTPQRRHTSNDGHRLIFAAIEKQDSAMAEAAARAHVETVFEQILRAAASGESPAGKHA